jgi:hypothetical protein
MAGRLKRWMADPDRHEGITWYHEQFKKIFAPNATPEGIDVVGEFLDLFGLEYDEELSRREQHTPDDLLPLICRNTVRLHARIVFKGGVYSNSYTHTGNSLILFPECPGSSRSIPGSIKYIFFHCGHWSLAVQSLLPSSNIPWMAAFSRYPHFPAKVYSAQLSDTLHHVELDVVRDRFIRTRITESEVVVIAASVVCSISVLSFISIRS